MIQLQTAKRVYAARVSRAPSTSGARRAWGTRCLRWGRSLPAARTAVRFRARSRTMSSRLPRWKGKKRGQSPFFSFSFAGDFADVPLYSGEQSIYAWCFKAAWSCRVGHGPKASGRCWPTPCAPGDWSASPKRAPGSPPPASSPSAWKRSKPRSPPIARSSSAPRAARLGVVGLLVPPDHQGASEDREAPRPHFEDPDGRDERALEDRGEQVGWVMGPPYAVGPALRRGPPRWKIAVNR
jgi:hypothetical protein